MSTTAVTVETPAVSSPKDTPNSNFLETDAHYRLTGEKRASQEAVTAEPKEKSAPEVEDSSTAAASEAATEQEKGPAQTKTVATSESRWAKITRENRELREENARFKGQQEGRESVQTPREVKQDPQPATEVKANQEPQLEDVDEKSGKAKYATLGEYLAAHSKWTREETIREFQETSAKQQREQQLAQTEQIINQTVQERVEAARKAYTDYDEAITGLLGEKDDQGRDAFFFTKGSHIDGFILDSEVGNDVLYHIAKNFADYKHIFQRDEAGKYLMNPVRQLRELSKIENSLSDKSKPTPVPKVTQAPRPPHQVSGKGTIAKDAIEQAVKDGDSETYRREANSRDPRLLAVMARRPKG
jgi:hypothetical protein